MTNSLLFIATLLGLLLKPPSLKDGAALLVSGNQMEQEGTHSDTTLYSYQFQKDTTYSYDIVMVLQEGNEDEVFYSVLRKNKVKVDSLLLDVNDLPMGNGHFFRQNVLKTFISNTGIKGIDELGILTNEGLGEIWDGYFTTQMLFGRSGDKLVRELYTLSEGACYSFEPYSSGFTDREFILPGDKGGRKGRLIVETVSEEVNEIKGKNKTTAFYRDTKVYSFNGMEFIAEKNGLEAEYYYVVAKAGLNVRSEPYIQHPLGSSTKRARLNYGDRVKAIRRTNIKHKANGVTGYWVEIVYTEAGYQTAFVFSGYLSKNKP